MIRLMKSRFPWIFFLIATLLLFACTTGQLGKMGSTDPLPSWNEGAAKENIVEFVRRATDKGSEDFVSKEKRIAVFDNDGTLWVEQPIYIQLAFAMDQIKTMAPRHPEWQTTQPFQAVLENDKKGLMATGEKNLLQIVMASHGGMTTDAYEKTVADWLATARHPRFNRPYTEFVYQPMLELLDYLRANGFKTYIVSGGGVDFMRVFTEAVYGIPPEQVIGSRIKKKFEIRDGQPVIIRVPEIDFVDDKEGKPVGIHQIIGRRPIAAFGNSDGDLAMLQWTSAVSGPYLCLYVHHTDAQREWAYDRDSHIGRLDKGLDEAMAKGWTVVDMKNDWNRVFP